MSYHNERENQINEARSKIHLPKRTGERRIDASKPPIKHFAKGHDAILKGMQDGSELTRVCLLSGDIHVGKITNRDRYTITLDINGKKRVIYKHAIEYFENAGETDVSGTSTTH